MRRSMEWKTKRDDGTFYQVRVSFFGGKYIFQFKESTHVEWDYSRVPAVEDIQDLWDTIQRRYQRSQVTEKELNEARRLLQNLPSDE